eukprot:167766-Pyramimonas_sp.AAC.1
MGPRSAVLGWKGTHACGNIGAVGEAPYGATKSCTGWWGRMRAVALRPSLKLPVGPRNAVLGGGTHAGGSRWTFS